MSLEFDILTALRTLVANAAPGIDLRGFAEDISKPERIPAAGMIMGSTGDPGQPEVDLSPVSYTYAHKIPVEVLMPATAGDGALRALIKPIGDAVLANRSLGGLCNFLDITAPVFTSDDAMGALPVRVAAFDFLAEYTVSNPLGA